MTRAKTAWTHTRISILRYAVVGFFVVLSGVAIVAPGSFPSQARDRGWDQEAAAKYLDDRMDLWFASGKKLRTGESKTTCVSCHTTVPYVLARPALRRAMGGGGATPQEAKLYDETVRRVEDYDGRQLLYDHNEDKKTESRGTEATLNALILASADAAQGKREPSATTQKAFEQLWKAQRPDGAWDWLDFGLEPFETIDGGYFGATLAALAVGYAPGSPTHKSAEANPGIDRMLGYLKEKYSSQRLFNRTWILLASTRLKDLLTKAQRESLVAELQGKQHEDGGWSLESLGAWTWSKKAKAPGAVDAALLAKSDGYATGLIVYALRQSGLPARHPVVSKGLQWLRANQQDIQIDQRTWRAWRAYSLNFDREHGGDKGEPWRRMFMSDSATAFASLALLD
jgi:squalene-hopene/tetraprenyl-beta-curcumene cyclase